MPVLVHWLMFRGFLCPALPRRCRVAHGTLIRFFGAADQCKAEAGRFVWCDLLPCLLEPAAPTSQCDQQWSDTAAPADNRTVTPVPIAHRFAGTARPRVLSLRPLMVGSSSLAKEPHTTVPKPPA